MMQFLKNKKGQGTLPPKKRLFRSFLRKKARKKVPIMRTRDRREVLGWLMTYSMLVPLDVVGYFDMRGCSLNTWKQEEKSFIVIRRITFRV